MVQALSRTGEIQIYTRKEVANSPQFKNGMGLNEVSLASATTGTWHVNPGRRQEKDEGGQFA